MQSVLPNVFDERSDVNVAGAQPGAVLEEEAAAADGGGTAVRNGGGLSGGRRLAQPLRERDHVLTGDKRSFFSGTQLHTSLFDKALPVKRDVSSDSHFYG